MKPITEIVETDEEALVELLHGLGDVALVARPNV